MLRNYAGDARLVPCKRNDEHRTPRTQGQSSCADFSVMNDHSRSQKQLAERTVFNGDHV